MSEKNSNRITKIVNRVTFQQAEEFDIDFWGKMSAEDKLSEVDRLRKLYWSWKLGSYPQHIDRVVVKRSIYDI